MSWVLTTSRILNPDPAIANRAPFALALRHHGVAADVTRISKWEGGNNPWPPRVIEAYEALLDLPAGSVATLGRLLQRAGGRPPSAAIWSADDPANSEAELHFLIETATAPRPAEQPRLIGADWMRLAIGVTTFDRIFLPRQTWTEVCESLLRELARTTDMDQLIRYEAAATLIGHPLARRPLMLALGEWLTATDVQRVEPMIALLTRIPEPAVDDLVVRLLGARSPALRNGAILVAAVKLARGQFSEAATTNVERHLVSRLSGLRSHPDPGLVDLLSHLPSQSLQRLLADLPNPNLRDWLQSVSRDRTLVPIRVSNTLARSMAARVAGGTARAGEVESDEMLSRLIQESLFHTNRARRDLATVTLSSSPYAEAYARACLELAEQGEPGIAARAWAALSHLGHTQERVDVLTAALKESRPGSQASALTAASAAPGRLDEQRAAGVAALASGASSDEVRLAALGVLGLRAPEQLDDLPAASPSDARASAWWRQLGPRLVDREPGSGHP